MTLYTNEEKEQIKKQIKEQEEHTIQNLPFYEFGYSAYSLEKLLPADVPVVIVGKEINTEEIDFLKKISNKACVMVADTDFVKLIDEDIKIDFLVAGADSDGKVFGNLEECNIPLITGIGLDSKIIECHEGAKFLYYTGNLLEEILWNEARNVCGTLYRYNNLLLFPSNTCGCEVALGISIFIGAEQVYLLGDFENFEIPNIEIGVTNVREVCDKEEGNFLSNKVDLFCIETDMSDILMNVFPFFDESGRSKFHQEYLLLMNDLKSIKDIIQDSLEKYRQLYKLAIIGQASNEELRKITVSLNLNTEVLEKSKYINYILKKIEQLNQFKYDVNVQIDNEIAGVAIEAIDKFERMEVVCETLEECLENKREINVKNYTWKKKESNKKSILLICGSSQYNVLPSFTHELKKGFQILGYSTYIMDYNINPNEWTRGKQYSHYQNTVGLDYVLTMNGVYIAENTFFDSVINVKRHVFDNPNTKVVSLFVDHPLHHKARIDAMQYCATVVYPDKMWVKFSKKYWPEIRNVLFLAMGGIERKTEYLYSQKDNKVVFFGSYDDLCLIEEAIESNEYNELIWKVINLLKDNPDYTVEEAFEYIEEESGLMYSIKNIVMSTGIWNLVDNYIRQYFRQKILNTIIISGIDIEIYGSGYQQFASFSNVCIHEPVSMEQMLEICRGVRFVLNVQPWAKDGTQERVFNTMLGESICITDETKYLLEQFQDCENILFYKLSELEKLPSKILYYMQNEEEAAQIARKGYELAKEKHKWTKRAEELSELFKKLD